MINRIKALYYFIRLCINPESTTYAPSLQRALNKIATPKQKKRYVDKFKALGPGVIYSELINALDEKMPPGSFGKAVQEFHSVEGLNLGEVTIYRSPKDAFELITNDMWAGHDMTHVLTGFGSDVKGEMGTFGFLCAQYPSHMSVLLVAIGVINTLFHMRECEERFGALFRGWEIGKSAKSIIGVDWGRHWHRPLAEVRCRYNINLGVE